MNSNTNTTENDESIERLIEKLQLSNSVAAAQLIKIYEDSKAYNGIKYADNHFGPSVNQLRHSNDFQCNRCIIVNNPILILQHIT